MTTVVFSRESGPILNEEVVHEGLKRDLETSFQIETLNLKNGNGPMVNLQTKIC